LKKKAEVSATLEQKKEKEKEKENDQTKLSDYYPVSRFRKTYKRKSPPKPSVQTPLEKYFNKAR
jgi:hypothetical protein